MNRHRLRRWLLLALIALVLGLTAGCGNKGELVRPAPPATE